MSGWTRPKPSACSSGRPRPRKVPPAPTIWPRGWRRSVRPPVTAPPQRRPRRKRPHSLRSVGGKRRKTPDSTDTSAVGDRLLLGDGAVAAVVDRGDPPASGAGGDVALIGAGPGAGGHSHRPLLFRVGAPVQEDRRDRALVLGIGVDAAALAGRRDRRWMLDRRLDDGAGRRTVVGGDGDAGSQVAFRCRRLHGGR